MWFEEHDPPLHREGDKRWTVNGPTLYDYLDDSRSDVTAAYEAAVSEPGPRVEAAMNEFVAAMTAAAPGGRVAEHSVFSLLVEGYKRCGEESVVEDARGLVMNAVVRSQDLGKQHVYVSVPPPSMICARSISYHHYSCYRLTPFDHPPSCPLQPRPPQPAWYRTLV